MIESRWEDEKSAATGSWRFPRVEEGTLGNGLRTVVCSLPDRPLVEVSLVTDAGAGRDPLASAGMASVVAGVALAGTQRRDPVELLESLELLGATVVVTAAWDHLAYTLSVPNVGLVAALELLAEVVSAPALEDDVIVRALVVAQMRSLAAATRPRHAATRAFDSAAFAPGTRFGLPFDGTAETLGTIDPDGMRTWRSAHVAPASTSLILVGDLRGLDGSAGLERIFGRWSNAAEPLSPLEPAALQRHGSARMYDFPGLPQSSLLVGQASEPVAGPEEDAALAVAADVLAGGIASRLVAELREKRKLAYSVGCRSQSFRQASTLGITARVEHARLGEAVDAIVHQVSTIGGDLGEEEVRRSAERLTFSAQIRFSTVEAVRSAIVEMVAAGRTISDVHGKCRHFADLTVEDVAGVFERRFNADRLVVGAAAVASEALAGLEDVLPDVTVVRPQRAPMAVAAPSG